jgi:four helix bundle protein
MDQWANVAVSAWQWSGHIEETATSTQTRRKTGAFVHGIALARPIAMADRARIDALEQRTKQFALTILHVVRQVCRQPELRSACDQLNDAAGSVAANHRAVGRARSTKEFAAKLQIVCEESDESAHWLAILQETNREAALKAPISNALQEAIELRNIFAKSRATTRNRYFSEKKPKRRDA